jgi:hypothetical protein
MMLRVTLIGHDGQITTPKDLDSAADLREAADRARALVCECELLMRIKVKQQVGPPQGPIPYTK